ncbi:Uncharacterized conserved protein [Parasphingorhabdus marina DSM 22363]|uniref:Uncharacterized conserved protein n=1 Tax=Parasphingorhabdus marina DSM 22363 TaxID=1123272 RepID=A0A1N6GRZ4_9SPHN|nr:YciI family protein [Parasphingorhabdus marina]SIO10252.1 Uncharacterized conserved protein [Parasphingorhabdus marina DSM 22363]
MTKYLLAYHGGKTQMSPEEGQQHMQKWMAWMDGLGDAVVDRGIPVSNTVTVSSDDVTEGGGANPLSGITIIEADSQEAAIEMTRKSPHLDIGGTIELAQAMDMPM